MPNDQQAVLTRIQPVLDQLLPIVRSFAVGKYAVALSGSFGKGTFDGTSDIDLRLYAEAIPAPFAEMGEAIRTPKAEWGKQGIKIDDFWPRKIADIDAALDGWFDGKLQASQLVWTVWGYHLLPDLYYQQPLDDPYAIVAGWKTRLQHYPPKLKKALLDKHLGSLRYWRHDYHYAGKVQRQDIVFLAGLSVKLVHDLIQVLFALNETYYIGDGYNVQYLTSFAYQPPDVANRLQAILYPAASANRFEAQRNTLLALIDDVEQLATSCGYAADRWAGLA